MSSKVALEGVAHKALVVLGLTLATGLMRIRIVGELLATELIVLLISTISILGIKRVGVHALIIAWHDVLFHDDHTIHGIAFKSRTIDQKFSYVDLVSDSEGTLRLATQIERTSVGLLVSRDETCPHTGIRKRGLKFDLSLVHRVLANAHRA